MSLGYGQQVADTKIRGPVAAQDNYRERNGMPSRDQQLQRPTNTRANQSAQPQLRGLGKRQTRAADSLVQTPPQQHKLDPAGQSRSDRQPRRA